MKKRVSVICLACDCQRMVASVLLRLIDERGIVDWITRERCPVLFAELGGGGSEYLPRREVTMP